MPLMKLKISEIVCTLRFGKNKLPLTLISWIENAKRPAGTLCNHPKVLGRGGPIKS